MSTSSTSTSPTTPSSLHAFFIFNPNLGEESTEGRKILYFHDGRPDVQSRRHQPGTTNYCDLNYEKDLCGISEGLLAFTRDFNEGACDAVHTKEHRYAFFQPEPDYWMVVVVKNPSQKKEVNTTGKEKEKDATASKGKDPTITEYLTDELEDSVLHAILHRSYSLFHLFNSSFTSIVSSSSHDALRVKLSLFMDYFLPTIRFSQLIYFTDIHGFQFLPIDKISFLTIQYIINLLSGSTVMIGGSGGNNVAATNSSSSSSSSSSALQPRASRIKNCALMYNNKLIYTGLSSDIMFLLYSLDQEPMYSFLCEYLTLKENLHLDVETYMKALKAREAAQASNPPSHKDWEVPGPAHIDGIYNIPESIYEYNGRQATNRKQFDRAQNKGIISQDEEWREEDEMEWLEKQEKQKIFDQACGVASRAASSLSSTNVASSIPFGYQTGPYRSTVASPLASTPTLSSTASSIPIPPCINSPEIYLDTVMTEEEKKKEMTETPNFQEFPIPTDTTATTIPAASSSSTPAAKSLRLVVYQKYKITLFLIVEEDDLPASTSAKPVEPTVDAAAAAMGKLQMTQPVTDSSSSSVASTSSLAITTPLLTPSPALTFYTSLEMFMDSNLKKLGDMLAEQSQRLNLNASTSTNVSTSASAAAGTAGLQQQPQQVIEEPYRFLYFNHMNLALKTSLAATSTSASSAATSGAGKSSSSSGANPTGSSGTSLLTMETIKIIRELHRDFNTPDFKSQSIAKKNIWRSSEDSHVRAEYVRHHIREEGCTEVCVKTKSHGWVVGRRATQSHREFFLLLDEKITTLAEIQEEVDNLARTYFYNIFIH